MEVNSREKIRLILLILLFIVAATYRTILFGKVFQEKFGKRFEDLNEEINLEKSEANWNWTLFAKKGF